MTDLATICWGFAPSGRMAFGILRIPRALPWALEFHAFSVVIGRLKACNSIAWGETPVHGPQA